MLKNDEGVMKLSAQKVNGKNYYNFFTSNVDVIEKMFGLN